MTDDNEVVRLAPAKNRGGVWVVLGLEEYRIPPLGFGAIRELQARLDLLQGMTNSPTAEQMNAVIEIVQMAMQRNYPDITVEAVRDMIDLGNFKVVLDAVLNTSGFRKVEAGEA